MRSEDRLVREDDRAALEELSSVAPGDDLRAVANLALSDPGAFDPTRTRAALKRMGVRNEPLPRLDLLRLACVAHNKQKPTRPQALANAARERPVLEGALLLARAAGSRTPLRNVARARTEAGPGARASVT